jgi:hypothetical protein
MRDCRTMIILAGWVFPAVDLLLVFKRKFFFIL